MQSLIPNIPGNPVWYGIIIEGIPRFATISEALAAIPEPNTDPFIVCIRNGRYYEKLRVDRPFVHFIGESWDGTVITYDATGDTPAPGGGTDGTAVASGRRSSGQWKCGLANCIPLCSRV